MYHLRMNQSQATLIYPNVFGKNVELPSFIKNAMMGDFLICDTLNIDICMIKLLPLNNKPKS